MELDSSRVHRAIVGWARADLCSLFGSGHLRAGAEAALLGLARCSAQRQQTRGGHLSIVPRACTSGSSSPHMRAMIITAPGRLANTRQSTSKKMHLALPETRGLADGLSVRTRFPPGGYSVATPARPEVDFPQIKSRDGPSLPCPELLGLLSRSCCLPSAEHRKSRDGTVHPRATIQRLTRLHTGN
jgi:hypothetical protein